MEPLASVVTAVHGNVPALAGLLEALSRQQPTGRLKELVIVDNHREPRVPQGFGAGIVPGCDVVIVHEPSLGLSRARNAGIRVATGRYVLITDADSRPRSGWVDELVDALEESGAFCAGGRTVPMFGFDAAREPDTSDVLSMFVPLKWPSHRTQLREPYWLIGCNLAFRNHFGAEFDEDLGVVGNRHLSCEDLEFVIRAQAADRMVLVAPGAVVERAVHRDDLRRGSLVHRAYWHGVSMARVHLQYGSEYIYDSYRVRDVVRNAARLLASRESGAGVTIAMSAARVAGFRLEQTRLGLSAITNRRPPS